MKKVIIVNGVGGSCCYLGKEMAVISHHRNSLKQAKWGMYLQTGYLVLASLAVQISSLLAIEHPLLGTVH
jgi:hypothetical protein